jgi:hypothetical protein
VRVRWRPGSELLAQPVVGEAHAYQQLPPGLQPAGRRRQRRDAGPSGADLRLEARGSTDSLGAGGGHVSFGVFDGVGNNDSGVSFPQQVTDLLAVLDSRTVRSVRVFQAELE